MEKMDRDGLEMTAYVSSTAREEQLAMVRNQDGDIVPAWVRIKDDSVTHIMLDDGKYHKVEGIRLDTRVAKKGVVWEFPEPLRLGNVVSSRFRVVDIGHNMFEAVGATAYRPGEGDKGSKNYRPPVPYRADIPCFIHDWGKLRFRVKPPVPLTLSPSGLKRKEMEGKGTVQNMLEI